MSEAPLNPNDLSNGHYPHLRRVAIDDPEWADINNWLRSKGAPPYTRLFVPKGLGQAGDNLILPTEMHWERPGAETLKLDAALVFNFPHVALVELKQAFGFGNPNIVEMYPGLRKPLVTVPSNPIGEPWPERGPNAYRPSLEDKFDYGSVVTTPQGTFEKQSRWWVFVRYPVWIKL